MVEGHQSLLRERLGIDQLVVSHCIVHKFFSWDLFLFITSPPPNTITTTVATIIIIIVFYFIQIIKLFYLNTWVLPFPYSCTHPTREWGVKEQLCGTYLLPLVKPG